MLTLNLTDHLGRARLVKMKGPDELTLADWKQLATVPLAEAAQEDDVVLDGMIDDMYRLVEEYTGIPQADLDKMSMKGVGQILGIIRAQLIEALKGSGDLLDAVSAGVEYYPKGAMEIAGQRWRVPPDVELDTIPQQWKDLEDSEPPQHEADVFTQVLACMLLDSDGWYSGRSTAKVEAMAATGMAHAIDLCAYYFANSSRFRDTLEVRSGSFRSAVMNTLVTVACKIAPNDKATFAPFAELQR